ncbi:MAG: aldose 1-epimerase [Ginsengibacter sp.]
MFSVHSKSENGFDKIVLQDDDSKSSAHIVPSCGAILQSFTLLQNGKLLNVIESYKDAGDFKENVASKGFLGCKLSPFVCRINKGRYHFGDKDYHLTKYYTGDSALHGELYDVPFAVTGKKGGEESAVVSMKYSYRKSDPGYPFDYDCTITYVLEKENTLNVITLVENKDQGLIPIQDGWHPYFTLGEKIDELLLEFQAKEIVEFNSELIPTGRLIPYNKYGSLKRIGNDSLDNCFTLNFAECQPMCLLRSYSQKLEVQIMPDPSYPYLQLYTPLHRNSIAIENISSVPDAFNNGIGLKILSAGESVTFKTSYRISQILKK